MVGLYIGYGSKGEMYRDKLNAVGEMVEAEFDDDFVLEIALRESSGTWVEANTCKDAEHIELSCDLAEMPPHLLKQLIDNAMTCAQTGDSEEMPEVKKWIHQELWKHVDRSDVTPPGWGVMRKNLREALRLLKDRGLLDDLPPGVIFSRSFESVPRRIVRIPEDFGDENDPVDVLAVKLYKECIMRHVVLNTIYGYDVDAPMECLVDDQENYATETIMYNDAPADGE